MSKWFSARSKAALAALALVASVAACQRTQEAGETRDVRASTVVEPEMAGIDSVPEEEPAVARAQWRADNDLARSVAGNLRISLEGPRGGPIVLAFANGVTVRAQPIDVVASNEKSGVGAQSFAAVLGGDPRVRAHLYRVLDDNVTRSAAEGGLCGQTSTRFMAISEFVDGQGDWVLKIAAFKGEQTPGAAGRDPDLCATYPYKAPD